MDRCLGVVALTSTSSQCRMPHRCPTPPPEREVLRDGFHKETEGVALGTTKEVEVKELVYEKTSGNNKKKLHNFLVLPECSITSSLPWTTPKYPNKITSSHGCFPPCLEAPCHPYRPPRRSDQIRRRRHDPLVGCSCEAAPDRCSTGTNPILLVASRKNRN